MLVQEMMSLNPIVIKPETSLHDALRIMREHQVRRLPVLNGDGKLVGIVLEKDLLYASPSPATSLSVYEMNYLMSKITIGSLMTRDVITIAEDCPLEEAARIMADNQIGGLPVMRDGKLLGMITESDLFKVFLDLLGARDWGLRVTMLVQEGRGVLARLTQAISALDADIVALSTFQGDGPSRRKLTVKVQGLTREQMTRIVQDLGAELLDIREMR
jgi:acetoin utilization protein AcuB